MCPGFQPGLNPKGFFMSEIMKLGFDSSKVRIIKDGDEIMFVGKDVCSVLGYKDSVNALKQHCDGTTKHHPIHDSLGRTQTVRIIGESDVYRLIIGSELPSAQPFKRWLFREVLPQIRKQGFYADTDQRLTSRTKDEIAEGLLAVANEIRKALPKLEINDDCVFIQDSTGKRSSLDGTREEVAYHRAMDARGLPGITVDKSRPITITFDWRANRHIEESSLESIYKALAARAKNYRSANPHARPFTSGADCESVTGFKSAKEAVDFAGMVAGMVRDRT
jgi:prophage antirepressor-like protein